MKPYWVAPNLGIVQYKLLRYVLEKREGGESFEVSVDEANCFAPLGWICNGLIDEKFFGGGLQAAILKLFLRHKTRWRRRRTLKVKK